MPLTWWLLPLASGAALWWIFVLATPMAVATAVGVASFTSVTAALWHWGAVRITVSDDVLRAGAATVPLRLCADAVTLDASATRALRGPLADARAFLLLRPYIATGVRVGLADARDPTPYWLLSSRRPDELAGAVRTGTLRASR